ncbi:MAG: CHAT domain-containing protein [Phycisphaerales bacterium]
MSAPTPTSGLPDLDALRAEADAGRLHESGMIDAAERIRRFALSDLALAAECADQLMALAQEHPRAAVAARVARACVRSYEGQLDEARADLERATEDSQAMPLERARARVVLVQPLARLGRLDEAAGAAREAAEALDALGAPIEAAKARTNEGIVLRMKGMPAEALWAFEASRAVLAGDALACAVIDSNRAEALLDLDRFDEAARAFEDARLEFESGGNTHAAAIAEGNLADLYSRLGRLDEALPRFERARRVFEAAGSTPDVARLCAEEAEALASFGAWREASARYADALALLRTAGLRRELSRACFGFGSLLVRQGDHVAGLVTLDEGRAALSEMQAEVPPEVRVLALIARVRAGTASATDLGSIRPALTELLVRPVVWATLAAEIASALVDAQRLPDAESIIVELEDTARNLTVVQQARVDHVRARLASNRGDVDQAADRYRRATASAERLRYVARSGDLRASFADGWHRLPMEACVAALDAGRIEDAFRACELFRSRALAEAVVSGSARRGAPAYEEDAADLSRRHVACIDRLRVLYSRAEQQARTGQAAGRRDSMEAMHRLEAQREMLSARLQQAASEPLSDVRTPSLREAADAVPVGTATIAYFADEHAFGAFILSPGRAEVRWPLAPRRSVSSLCRKIRLIVEEATSSNAPPASTEQAWRAITADLYRALVEPIERHLGGANVLHIAPFGELHDVPFHGLHTGEGWMHDRARVAYIPGISAAEAMKRRARANFVAGPALFIGVADEVAPWMEREASTLASLVLGANSLTGSGASVKAVRDTAPGASLLHLAAHCTFSPMFPGSSRVRLADGWLTARELAACMSPGTIAVVAGCESGRGSFSPGEERLGLVRTLLSAGCQHVVHAPWRLHDASSLALLSNAYGRVIALQRSIDSRPLAESLHAAQREACVAGMHPAHWAAFFVTGGYT